MPTRFRGLLKSERELKNVKGLEKWRLKKLCKKHEIDIQEIDDTLTYWENKSHLETMIPKDFEALVKTNGKSMMDQYDATPIHETYGADFGPTTLFTETELDCKFGVRHTTILRMWIERKYSKTVFIQQKGYLTIKAEKQHAHQILRDLSDKIYIRLIGEVVRPTSLKRFQYIDGLGYVRSPENM